MNCIVTTLNAKYIHQSLALRLLYVANQERGVTFMEFSLKEQLGDVAKLLLAENPDVIGIGVYIWNVEQTGGLIKLLRERSPNLIIIIGGPEVTYEPELFLDKWAIDYVISGEGEFVLGELLDNIKQGVERIEIDGVSSRHKISKRVVRADLERLSQLPSPYTLEEDRESLESKVIYVETSRGCPYHCQYCLSSLEQGVRYMPKKYVFDNLKWLIDSGAKQIKFLDRTFNINMEHTMEIFNFLIENHRPGVSCQFEIYADILKPETIAYLNRKLPDNYFRFEIGIQSTHNPTNEAVQRHQDFDTLSRNIKQLMEGGKIDLHLDLIAGLPYETLPLFICSFNDVFSFGAKELQLGFLKMLRGTGIRRDAELHGYNYDTKAPYEIKHNNYLPDRDIQIIKNAEGALDKFWNSGRFTQTMDRLMKEYYSGKYFDFFDQMGKYYRTNNLPHRGYQLEELFLNFYNFLVSRNIDLLNELRYDYYRCFPQRPNKFFLPMLDKSLRKRIATAVIADTLFMEQHRLSPYMVRKQSAIDRHSSGKFLLTVYDTTEGSALQVKEIEYEYSTAER